MEHKLEKFEDFDIEERYEEIGFLKDFKIESLEKIIRTAIKMKYKISFYKGVIFFCEALIMISLMISIALKSNFFALIYLIFVIRYPFLKERAYFYKKLALYISICIVLQYAFYWLNLTVKTEVQHYKFPKIKVFENFPF